MTVRQRLVLSALPGILGLLLMAALADPGQRWDQQPAIVIGIALLAALLSALATWFNVRYVAGRLDRHDALERALKNAVAAGEEWRRRDSAAEARARQSVGLLEEAVDEMGTRLKEVQLPLHILLSSPFGELNENQEEILAAARSATDAADFHLRQLAKLVELELGSITIVPQKMSVSELLRPALAIAEARSASRHVSIRANVSQAGARAIVDPVHAQEALSALLVEAVEQTDPGGEVRIDYAEEEDRWVRIVVAHGAAPTASSLEHRLARRLIEAQRGELDESAGSTTITLPSEWYPTSPTGA
jgi:signal transduction histidine kinase